jgi:secretion/DNA translocation related TadE-like protein
MVLVGVLVTATVMVGALGGVIADQRRVEAAADLAALAAAGALRAGEDPCPAAGSIARRNGAALAGCAVAREVVRVRVNRRTHPLLGRTFTVTAQARAGPVS